MNLPSNVLNATDIRAPKGIIYGPPGVGKTTFGASTCKPILVDCENGAAHVKCDRTPYLTDWPSIKQWLDSLATAEHGYSTVVIDSLDWLLRRIEEFVSGVDGSSAGMSNTLNRSHGGYGNGKQVLKNYVYQYLLSDNCQEHEHCNQSFEVLFKKIDKLDEAVRGNGKPGIMIRLDRLEQSAKTQAKLIWLLLGALGTCIATAVAMWIAG